MNSFPKTLMGFYAKNFWRYFGKNQIIWSIVYIIATSAQSIFQPLYMKYFTRLLESFGTNPSFVIDLLHYGFIALGVVLVLNILYTIYSIIGNWVNPKISNKISEDLCDYVYSQSVGFYTATMPGKIQNQVSLVAGGLRNLYVATCGQMIAILIGVAVNFGLVFGINWRIALILIVGTVFRILWSLYRRKPIVKTSKAKSDASSKLNGKILDSISNFMIIKLFAGAKTEKKNMAAQRIDNVSKQQQSGAQMAWFWLLPSLVEDSFVIIVMAASALLFAGGNISIADAIFAITAYSVVSGKIWDFVYNLPNVLDSYSQASKAYESLVKPIEIQDTPNAPVLKVWRGLIELRGVSFKYKKIDLKNDDDNEDKKAQKSPKRRGTKAVLENFSLVIHPGEKVGLVGSSGAGKTTLVNLLMRFYDPNKGAIYIDGQNIREVAQDSLRENIAFIPQEPTMFNRTLRENIGYGNPSATDREIHKAARQAQADKFIMEAPKKYESQVGDRGIKLSGGQRQRIAIARAFLKNAPILILDEATSALDSETEAAIQKSFEELSRGRTTIAIAHRLSTLRNMDRIVVMENGRIAEQGTHAALLRKKNGIYARLWKMQSGGFLKE